VASAQGQARLEAVAAREVQSVLLAPVAAAEQEPAGGSSDGTSAGGSAPQQVSMLAATIRDGLRDANGPLLGLAAQAVTAQVLRPLLPVGTRVMVQRDGG